MNLKFSLNTRLDLKLYFRAHLVLADKCMVNSESGWELEEDSGVLLPMDTRTWSLRECMEMMSGEFLENCSQKKSDSSVDLFVKISSLRLTSIPSFQISLQLHSMPLEVSFATTYYGNVARLTKRMMAVKLARRDVLITANLPPPSPPSNLPPRAPHVPMAMHAAQLTVQYTVPQAPLLHYTALNLKAAGKTLPALHRLMPKCSVCSAIELWKIHDLCNALHNQRTSSVSRAQETASRSSLRARQMCTAPVVCAA
jgi:hypothetical protein